MNKWVTKANLAQAIYTGRRSFDVLVSACTPGEFGEPVLDNGWTVKDILAHVTLWETCVCDWVRAVQRGEVPQRPAPGYTWETMDQYNEDSYAAKRDCVLDEVQADYRASGVAILSVLSQVTDEDLNSPYFEDTGVELWRAFCANTTDHYREPGELNLAWRARQTAG